MNFHFVSHHEMLQRISSATKFANERSRRLFASMMSPLMLLERALRNIARLMRTQKAKIASLRLVVDHFVFAPCLAIFEDFSADLAGVMVDDVSGLHVSVEELSSWLRDGAHVAAIKFA